MQVAERVVRVWGLRTLGHVCGAEEGMASGDAGERSSGWVMHTFWTLFYATGSHRRFEAKK